MLDMVVVLLTRKTLPFSTLSGWPQSISTQLGGQEDHEPEERHSKSWSPLRAKPWSQVKVALPPILKVVSTIWPLDGWLKGLHKVSVQLGASGFHLPSASHRRFSNPGRSKKTSLINELNNDDDVLSSKWLIAAWLNRYRKSFCNAWHDASFGVHVTKTAFFGSCCQSIVAKKGNIKPLTWLICGMGTVFAQDLTMKDTTWCLPRQEASFGKAKLAEIAFCTFQVIKDLLERASCKF